MSWKEYKLNQIDKNIEELERQRTKILNSTEEPNLNRKWVLKTSVANQFMIIQKSIESDNNYNIWVVITDSNKAYICDEDYATRYESIIDENYLQRLSDGWFSSVESFKKLINGNKFENVPSNLVLELLIYLN